MAILPRLVALYEREGFSISSGLDASLSGTRHSEFTFLFDDTDSLTGALGIALKEVYFLECLLGGAYRPKRVFGVGSSFGWSSLAMALLLPDSKHAVLELGDEAFTNEWIGRVNTMATREGLPLTVVQGASPVDTAATVWDHLDGGVDLAFIDGPHNPDQVKADVAAVLPFLTPPGAILLHDVIAFNLVAAVREIIAETGLMGRMLHATPSGLAVLHGPDWPEEARLACRCFGANRWAPVMLDHFRDQPADFTLGSELL
ncbi:MAG: class I SAM-dependent methyltransferase [Rhodospirillum sp.]|nr:class I SAM-dependent methyltransferase [Rhodospirillum sp.]MCF8488844.1 class I SAM-dependent methyltransferase [Rhodospirillum sp.]MCF8500647.1 class I SAM-dependent methyltransferase [Rhodospirillum sp.]